MWKVTATGTGYEKYSGNDTLTTAGLGIFNTQTVVSPDYTSRLGSLNIAPVTFSNGNATKSWNEGTWRLENNGGGNMTWTAVDVSSIFGMQSIFTIAYGNNIFVAGGGTGKMAYSSDGITWTAATAPGLGSNGINAITYGNSKFVAVGSNGNVVASTDGTTWTLVMNNFLGTMTFGSSNIDAIAYGNNTFVAGGANGKMAYSSDNGVTWTAVDVSSIFGNGTNDRITAIAYGNNMFVAGGSSSSNAGITATSADGVLWTTVENGPFTNGIETLAYVNNKFVVSSYGNMATSTDGNTWTATGRPSGTGSILGIAYGNNKFVAVGARCKLATSTDGNTWTAVTDNPFGEYGTSFDAIPAIAYGNNMFVAGGGKMAYSPDN
jgi:hypothetical protein